MPGLAIKLYTAPEGVPTATGVPVALSTTLIVVLTEFISTVTFAAKAHTTLAIHRRATERIFLFFVRIDLKN